MFMVIGIITIIKNYRKKVERLRYFFQSNVLFINVIFKVGSKSISRKVLNRQDVKVKLKVFLNALSNGIEGLVVNPIVIKL